jgi:hypothetical protein
MFTIKKIGESMIIGWQEIEDEIINSLLLKENEAIVNNCP